MKEAEYIPPTLQAKAFNCPNCRVYAKQDWMFMQAASQADGFGMNRFDERFLVSYCGSCGFPTIWLGKQIVYPDHTTAEPPNLDLPTNIRRDYDEARSILNKSPRGAAALLRLAIQNLCKHMGQPGKNINEDIKALVAQGLPLRVQEALDSVRVIGNESVHPGQLDLRDDRDTASKLFKLVNFVATKLITEPKEMDEIYGKLPADKRDAIDKRDGRGN